MAIGLVGSSDDQDLRLRQHLLQGFEVGVTDVRISAEYAGTFEGREPLQLVAQRRPRVIGFGFEGHAQNPHGAAIQGPPSVEGFDDEARKPFVDQHRGVAHREVVGRKGRQLHGVFQQARTGGQTRPGQVGCPGIVISNGMKEAVVVDAGAVGDLEELVGNRELRVSPGVGQELGEFCLFRGGPDELDVELFEEFGRARIRLLGIGADQLWQGAHLLYGVPLGHPFGTGDNVNVLAQTAQSVFHKLRRARINRAPQEQQSAVSKVRAKLIHDAIEEAGRWIQEFVDGSADHHHDDGASIDERGIGAQQQPPVLERRGEERRSSALTEGHLATANLSHLLEVDVIDADPATDIGEAQRKGKADMPATAHDHQIEVVGSARGGGDQVITPAGVNPAACGILRSQQLHETEPLHDGVDLLLYPVMVGALLLPAAWFLRRGEPPLEAIAIGAALGVLTWGSAALFRFLLVLPDGLARRVGLVTLTVSVVLGFILWTLTRHPKPAPGSRVPRAVWAAIGGGALLTVGLEASLPHFGVIQWSFDWWLHFDLARFYLAPADLWRVYPGGDVISSRTPLYNLLGSLALQAFGNRFSILQVFTAAEGWLWLLPAALLTRRLCGGRTTVLALLALSPLLAFANAYVWPKGLVTFMLLLALDRVLALPAAPAGRAGRIAVQAGLASGGAMMAHAGFVGFLLPLVAFVAWDGRRRRDPLRFACFAAGTGLVLLPWYAWSVAEYGWQRGLLGYFHAQSFNPDLLNYGVQRLVILVSGIVPVVPPLLGLTQGYFLIYLGSAAGVGGVVVLVWTAAQHIRSHGRGPDGWRLALWFVVSGMVAAAVLSRQYTVGSAATLFSPALVVLAQLAIGARKVPALVLVAALLETALFAALLLAWMWSSASSAQPNAQLAVAEHIQFISHATLPAGIALMVAGVVACLPALGLPFRIGTKRRSVASASPALGDGRA
jgi:hypothetical protein